MFDFDKYKDDLILTGTKFYGISTENSDYDYICNSATFEEIQKDLKTNEIEFIPSITFVGIKFQLRDGKYINLICLSSLDKEIWKVTGNLIKAILAEPYKNLQIDITNKKNVRIALFREIAAMIRTFFVISKTDEEYKENES